MLHASPMYQFLIALYFFVSRKTVLLVTFSMDAPLCLRKMLILDGRGNSGTTIHEKKHLLHYLMKSF